MSRTVLVASLGTLFLLVLVVAACSPEAPLPAATSTPQPQSSSADAIDAVYGAWAVLPSAELSPLFGDRPEDRADIVRLASALDSAIPFEPTERLRANDRWRYLTIRYRDGTKRTVRHVAWCDQWSGGKDFVGGACRGEFKSLNDTWWVEGTGMVQSPELGAWWEDSTAFMRPMGIISIPKTIKPGEPFSVRGYDWKSNVGAPAETVRLSLVSLDERELQLGEIGFGGEGVGRDGFIWQAAVPEQTPGGRYFLRVATGDFSGLVRIVYLEKAAPEPTPTPSPRRVYIASGVLLEAIGNSNWALLWSADGQVQIGGDGGLGFCEFRTEEGRRVLEGILADEASMARIRAYLEEWGISGNPVDRSIGPRLQAPAEVQPGAEAVLKVSIYNGSDCPTEYLIGDPALDFSVTRLGGTEVWRRSRGKTAGTPITLRLGAKEERAFEVTWDLLDNDGRPLSEGAYWVQGYLNGGRMPGAAPQWYPSSSRLLFIGPRLPLTNWLEADLEMKQDARSEEPVEFDLKILNRSDEPVTVFHGSRPFDFIVRGEDGKEVWRWSRRRWFTLGLEYTLLQPGETLTYSATWDQRDQDCEPDPRVLGLPCSGNPVSPGRYTVLATFEGALSSDYREYRETIQAAPKVLEVLP